jgi:hypothetical protein
MQWAACPRNFFKEMIIVNNLTFCKDCESGWLRSHFSNIDKPSLDVCLTDLWCSGPGEMVFVRSSWNLWVCYHFWSLFCMTQWSPEGSSFSTGISWRGLPTSRKSASCSQIETIQLTCFGDLSLLSCLSDPRQLKLTLLKKFKTTVTIGSRLKR